MDELERRLREYYERIEPDADFIERLKALEHSPEAKPKPRRVRRYLLPAAAALTAAVALGASWAYLRDTMPGNAPQPASAAEAPVSEETSEYYVNQEPEPAAADEPAPAAEPVPQAPEPEPEARAPANAGKPQTAPEPRESPAAQAPAQSTPQAPAPEERPVPPEPASLGEDGPAGDPEPPAIDPPKKPEDPPEPGKPDPGGDSHGVPIIFAQYQTEGSRETLTLSNLTTYETAVIDVTDLLPPPESASLTPQSSEGEAEASGSSGVIYTGECAAFGWKIRYTLVQLGSEVYAVAEAEDPD